MCALPIYRRSAVTRPTLRPNDGYMRCEIRGRTPSRVRSALGSCIVAMCPSDRCSLDHARGDSEDRTEAAKLRAGSSSSHRSERTDPAHLVIRGEPRSEEHTSELQSLMRISYAVFCFKK